MTKRGENATQLSVQRPLLAVSAAAPAPSPKKITAASNRQTDIGARTFRPRAAQQCAELLALYGKGMLLSEEQITEGNIALTMLKQAVQRGDLKKNTASARSCVLPKLRVNGMRRNLKTLPKISSAMRIIDSATLRRMAQIYLQLKRKDRARELSRHTSKPAAI